MNRNEECRWVVLSHLADRSTMAQTAGAIERGVNSQGYDFTLPEVTAALTFLESDSLIRSERDRLGSTYTYQITAEGVRTNERR